MIEITISGKDVSELLSILSEANIRIKSAVNETIEEARRAETKAATVKLTKPKPEANETDDNLGLGSDDEAHEETEEVKHTLKDVITELKTFAKSKGTDKAAKLLGKYKVKNVHDLPEKDYGKFISELR